MAAPFAGSDVSHVVGIEARGFIVAAPVAHQLRAGFVPVRKAGKLPWRTVAQEYALEYGTDTLELHVDGVGPGDRVLIVDDVLATGGTAQAAAALVAGTGATVVGGAPRGRNVGNPRSPAGRAPATAVGCPSILPAMQRAQESRPRGRSPARPR